MDNKIVAGELVKVAKDLVSAEAPWTEDDVADYLKRTSKEFLSLAKDVKKGKDVTGRLADLSKGMKQVAGWHRQYRKKESSDQSKMAKKKRVVIVIDEMDVKSIKKAERQKSKLENQGYTLVDTKATPFRSSLTYELI